MWARAAWRSWDNLFSLSTSPGSFFSWEPLGSLDELCCNLPTVAISFREPFPRHVKQHIRLGPEKGPFPLKRECLGKSCCPHNGLSPPDAGSPTIPDGCTVFPTQQARDACAHTCSRSGASPCLQEACDGLCPAVWVWCFDEEGEAVPSPLLLLQEDAGLF